MKSAHPHSLLVRLSHWTAALGALLTVSTFATTYYWDADGTASGLGGKGTWDTDSSLFRTGSSTGTLTSWANVATSEATVLFSGTGGTVAVKNQTVVDVNSLFFLTNGYSLEGSANSAIRFVGTDPELSIASGITVSLGTTLAGSALTLDGGGTLALANNGTFDSALALTIDGGSTLDFSNKSLSLASVTLADGTLGGGQNENGTLSVSDGATLESGTVYVTIAGSGDITKTGEGTVTVAQNKKFTVTGTTRVEAGTLQLTSSGQLSSSSALEVSGGTLNLAGTDQSVGGLTLAGGTIAGGKLQVTGSSGASLLAGTITSNLESNGLTKSSSGTATLTGSLDLKNGAIVVDGGLLDLTGVSSVNNPGNVTVNAGTFAASGTYSNVGLFLNGGAVSAGGDSAVGSLTFTGSSTWSSGTLDFNIWDAVGTAGSGYDLLTLNSLTLSSTGSYTISVLGLVSAAGGSGEITNFDTAESYSWTLLTAGSISGFSADSFTVDLSGFTNTYYGTFSVEQSGNSLLLIYTGAVVPEPAAYAAGLGLLTFVFAAVQRRRRIWLEA